MPGEPPIQLLTPDGKLRPNHGADQYLAAIDGLDQDFWLGAYRAMVEVRAFDREATMLQRQGELGLFAQCEGQEAASVGSALALRPQDEVFPSYREHGVCHVRGVDLVGILSLFRGVAHAGWDPAAHRVRNYTLVIAAQTLHAVGYAMGQRFDGACGTGRPEVDEASIVYFGDGSTSQGEANEALVYAASYEAPVVFFLQNNGWAISVPVERQSRTPLADRAAGFAMPTARIDGNDVMASYAVTRTLLDEARAGRGPAYIEAMTYRMGAHTTSDDPTRYRERADVEAWQARDPLARLERWLRAEGMTDAQARAIDEGAADFAADIRRRCLELAAPAASSLFDHVYTDPHPVMQEQQAWLERYEASFGSTEAAVTDAAPAAVVAGGDAGRAPVSATAQGVTR